MRKDGRKGEREGEGKKEEGKTEWEQCLWQELTLLSMAVLILLAHLECNAKTKGVYTGFQRTH